MNYSNSTVNRMILYWLLRAFTFAIAALLAFFIMTSFVWIPFYAGEGRAQFTDRIFGLIGDLLLLISIVIPHSWSARTPGLLFRITIIVLTVLWIMVVDVIAYQKGLTSVLFTNHGLLALVVATSLFATLAMQFKKQQNKRLEANVIER